MVFSPVCQQSMACTHILLTISRPTSTSFSWQNIVTCSQALRLWRSILTMLLSRPFNGPSVTTTRSLLVLHTTCLSPFRFLPIILLIPLCKFSESFAKTCAWLETKILYKLVNICIGHLYIAWLHRN